MQEEVIDRRQTEIEGFWRRWPVNPADLRSIETSSDRARS